MNRFVNRFVKWIEEVWPRPDFRGERPERHVRDPHPAETRDPRREVAKAAELSCVRTGELRFGHGGERVGHGQVAKAF